MNLSGKKTPILAVLLIAAAGGFGYFSAVEITETQDEITYTMYSEDMTEGRFDPDTPTNYASIKDLEIETSNLDMESFYFYACYEDVQITENGQTVFDETVQDALYNNEGIEDENLDSFNTPNGYEIDIERVRSSTTTEEFWDGWDTVVDDCYGSTITVKQPVELGDIDIELDIDDERDLEERVVGELYVDNQWEDIELDLHVELCVDDFCETAEVENIEVRGGEEKSLNVIDREGIGADISIDVDGSIKHPIDDVEGFYVDGGMASDTSSVEIAAFETDTLSEFSGSADVETEKTLVFEEPPEDYEKLSTIQKIQTRIGSLLSILPFIGE